MEGKLFKMVEGYTLSLTGSIDDLYGISNKQLAEDHQLHKLSIKNCDAIANGYDLIKLIEENSKYSEEDWGDGFLFAMNLMSDKKFSEEHLKVAADWYYETKGKKSIDEYIQSLQQTQWDVEIEMERSKFITDKSLRNNIKNGFNYTPKLDADGCLILKRK